jgi:hypothetical protein
LIEEGLNNDQYSDAVFHNFGTDIEFYKNFTTVVYFTAYSYPPYFKSGGGARLCVVCTQQETDNPYHSGGVLL